MKTGNKLMQSIFKRIPVDKALTQKPSGKRSVAMAQRGQKRERCYGNRTSHCVMTGKGTKKMSR